MKVPAGQLTYTYVIFRNITVRLRNELSCRNITAMQSICLQYKVYNVKTSLQNYIRLNNYNPMENFLNRVKLESKLLAIINCTKYTLE